MVLFLRGPQKRSGLISYGSGKDMGIQMKRKEPTKIFMMVSI